MLAHRFEYSSSTDQKVSRFGPFDCSKACREVPLFKCIRWHVVKRFFYFELTDFKTLEMIINTSPPSTLWFSLIR